MVSRSPTERRDSGLDSSSHMSLRSSASACGRVRSSRVPVLRLGPIRRFRYSGPVPHFPYQVLLPALSVRVEPAPGARRVGSSVCMGANAPVPAPGRHRRRRGVSLSEAGVLAQAGAGKLGQSSSSSSASAISSQPSVCGAQRNAAFSVEDERVV